MRITICLAAGGLLLLLLSAMGLCVQRDASRRKMNPKILILVFFLPAVLFLFLCIRNLSVSRDGLMVSSLGSYDEDDMEYYQKVPEIREWLQNSRQQDPEGIYVLCYQAETDGEEAAGRKRTVYLIYRPSAGYMKKVDRSSEKGFSGRTESVISFEDTADPGWAHAYYPMTCYIHEGYDYEGLSLVVDGQSADYELQEIDFDPSLDACYIRDGIFEER